MRSAPGTAYSVPRVAVRTAGVLQRLPDSGLVVRMTRGRAWIGVLSVLLTGIVALNVVSLSLSASQGKVSQQAMILEQENSALRARFAQRLSNGRVRSAAAGIGMWAPSPTDINYRNASHHDVRLAARRLANGFAYGSYLVDAPAPTVPETPVSTTAPVSTEPAPTTSTTTTSAPAAPVTASSPAAPTSSGSSGVGGVAPG